MRFAILAIMLACLPLAANCKDYYLRLGGGEAAAADIVLTQSPCDLDWIAGSEWRHSEVQLSGRGGVHTLGSGCWERIQDKVYVLEARRPFWVAPDGTGGDEYYRLDTLKCDFHVPGVSFAGWRSGRSVAVDEKRKAVLLDNGPICWRYVNEWLEEVDQPLVYSAFAVRASVLP